MGKWKRTELSPALCTIIAGSTPPTSDARYWDGNNVWVTPNDLSRLNGRVICDSERKLTELGVKRTTGKLLPANSVVISCRAPVGYCAVVSVPFTINQGCKSLICHSIDETYLYYYLSQSTEQLERVSSGTTFIELPKKELARFKVAYPDSCVEQAKIAEVLSTVDEAIDKTRALIDKYKNIKAGMMQDLLSSGEDVPLSQLCKIISGSTPPTSDETYWNGSHVWITPNDLSALTTPYISTSARKLSDSGVKKSTGVLLPANSVIISNRAPVGYCAIVSVPFTFNQGCKGLICNPDTDPLYLYYYLSKSTSQLEKVSSGTTFLELPKKELSRFMIRIPKMLIDQKAISEQLLAADERIQTERNYLEKLQNIKRGLMQDLLTNTVSVDTLM